MAAGDDQRYMARALELAARGLYTTDPNPRVGCVIVRDGEIVGEGWHERAGEPHAEIHALRAAGARAQGATAYVTLEPCRHHGRTPPCAHALVDARLGRVVVAMHDPNPLGAGGLDDLAAAGIEVADGVLADEAAALNPGFMRRMREGRPHVRVKLAASLDGRTAMASGESRWVTGEDARRDVHRWRARSSAILTSAETVIADDPSLTVRLPPDETDVSDSGSSQPLRVVIDSRGRMPADARLLGLSGRTLVFTRGGVDSTALEAAGAEVRVVDAVDGHVDLDGLLRVLAEREINEVWVEAGPGLAGALIAAGLADELVLYLAPHLMGDTARGLFRLPGLERMADRIPLRIDEIRPVGADWRVRARPGRSSG